MEDNFPTKQGIGVHNLGFSKPIYSDVEHWELEVRTACLPFCVSLSISTRLLAPSTFPPPLPLSTSGKPFYLI